MLTKQRDSLRSAMTGFIFSEREQQARKPVSNIPYVVGREERGEGILMIQLGEPVVQLRDQFGMRAPPV